MRGSLDRYIEELEKVGLSLLIYRGEEVIFSSARTGMKPLLEAIEALGLEPLRGTIVADKVVGRAAALLTVYMDVAEVHAGVVSKTAAEVLRSHGLKYYFGREVDSIKRQDGVIICPFERLVQEISDPQEAYERIRAKMSEF